MAWAAFCILLCWEETRELQWMFKWGWNCVHFLLLFLFRLFVVVVHNSQLRRCPPHRCPNWLSRAFHVFSKCSSHVLFPQQIGSGGCIYQQKVSPYFRVCHFRIMARVCQTSSKTAQVLIYVHYSCQKDQPWSFNTVIHWIEQPFEDHFYADTIFTNEGKGNIF